MGGRSERSKRPEIAAPKQLLAMAPMQLFSVFFSDDQGTVHPRIVGYDGQSFYFIGDEREAKSLQIPSDWLQTAMKAKLAERTVTKSAGAPPSDDDVDVTGEQ